MEMRDRLLALHLVALVEHVEDVAQTDFTEVFLAVDVGGLGQAAALAVPQDAERSFDWFDLKQLDSSSCR